MASLEKSFNQRSSSVRLENVTKVFPSLDGKGPMTAVDHIHVHVEDGKLMTLLGPSGCGKTTTLRMVSGFEIPTSGSIFIGDRDVANLPPNKRDIGMVFQSYALFPHMTIWENIAYGLTIKHVDAGEVRRRTEEVVELMGLQGMEKRYPNQLSGGQQQRVALARAVICQPKVLLFDEPLSNLDAKLRLYMRDELRKIQKRLNITSIYVTHDQSEAMAISDQVLIMKDGQIMQCGTPQEIYEYPANRFVADFIGTANFIPCTLKSRSASGASVQIGDRSLLIEQPGTMEGIADGDSCVLSVRPESIFLSADGEGIDGTVESAVYYGSKMEYVVEAAGAKLTVEIYDPKPEERYEPGNTVKVRLNTGKIRILPYITTRPSHAES